MSRGILFAALAFTIVLPIGFLAGRAFRYARLKPAINELRRRGELLATVAQASRSIGTLDASDVLAAVADASLALGYDAVEVCRFDPAGRTYRVIESRGLPDEYISAVHPTSTPVTRLVLERNETVSMSDYSADRAAIPALRAAGFRSVIGTPVWSSGKLAAVLVAGARENRRLVAEDVEAFEILAIQASIALENADRFQRERRTVEQLAELDRMKDDFLSTVSHELRTPLTAIEAAGFTLEERWTELDDQLKRELLFRLNANARTLESIITSLLDFARMTGGKPSASMKSVDLGTVLEAAAARVTPLFAERSLGVAVCPGLTVNADPMLIDRVVENLLSNAAKHTPKGSRVFLRALRTASDVTVSVSDDGPGIPPDELGQLGDRFFRGVRASKQRTRGLGLGLALVREILSAHGSGLRIESTPGAGTRFSFTLPLAAASVVRPEPAGV